MKFKSLLLATATAFAMPTIAAAGPGDKTAPTAPTGVSDLERTEILHRHQVNLMEIQMGRLAQKKGTAEVKKYGGMLAADHAKADKELMTLAKARGVKLTGAMSGDGDDAAHDKQMELMAKLETLDGAAFDREYLAAMVAGHTDELARVDSALPQVSDAKVKAMLEKTSTSLQKHADGARALQASATDTAPTAAPQPRSPSTSTPPATGAPQPPKPTPVPPPEPGKSPSPNKPTTTPNR